MFTTWKCSWHVSGQRRSERPQSNAAESYESKSGEILIRVWREELSRRSFSDGPLGMEHATGPCLLLSVADQGVGMSQEQVQRMFEPFYSTKFVGRGLGLAAVLGIVRSHGGGVQVSSAPGRGTELTVAFPVAVPTSD